MIRVVTSASTTAGNNDDNNNSSNNNNSNRDSSGHGRLRPESSLVRIVATAAHTTHAAPSTPTSTVAITSMRQDENVEITNPLLRSHQLLPRSTAAWMIGWILLMLGVSAYARLARQVLSLTSPSETSKMITAHNGSGHLHHANKTTDISSQLPVWKNHNSMYTSHFRNGSSIRLQRNNSINSMMSISTTPAHHRHRIALIVKLNGEMANGLSNWAHALIMKWTMEEAYPELEFDLLGEHQDATKWVAQRTALQQCFPYLATLTWDSGMWDPAFSTYEHIQNVMYQAGDRAFVDRYNPNCTTVPCWQDSVHFILEAIQRQAAQPHNTSLFPPADLLHQQQQQQQQNHHHHLTIPFLVTKGMNNVDHLVDKYYDRLLELFTMNQSACCGLRPAPDEVMFHYRNFVHENIGLEQNKGFQELDPPHAVSKLLAHIPIGTHVTIVSRGDLGNASNVMPFVHAFRQHGWPTRVLASRSGTHDFCFLISGQNELLGSRLSTYAIWAALLGTQLQNATLYIVDSPLTRRTGKNRLRGYSWQHPALRQRIRYQTIVMN